MPTEILHNLAGAERGRFYEGAIDLLRAGGERHAKEHPRQLSVYEHRTVAVPPV